jgi:stage V sporulation protein SpoVS
VFSGHLCSNLVHRMGKVDISPEDKKMGALAAELKAKASSEATAAAAAAVQRPAAADSTNDSNSSEAQPTSSEQTVSDSPESGASPCHVDSDAEEVWVEEKVDMQHITTAAVAQGLRIARVYEEGIEHEFFALDSVPHSVELRPARDAPHSSSSLH